MPIHAPFVDIHCHILPGIDDGARDLRESLTMARQAVADGIGTIIATPHQLGGYVSNRGDALRQMVAHLQARLQAERIPLRVLPGADVRIEAELVSLLACGEVLSLADGRKHVLLELPHEVYMPLERLVTELRAAGYTGILSHPERNLGILGNPELVPHLIQLGLPMQLTADSLLGGFGREIQSFSEQLVRRRQVHFVSTDAHGARHRRPLLQAAFDRVAELADHDFALAVCCHNPANVAAGRDIALARPAPVRAHTELVSPAATRAGEMTKKLSRLAWIRLSAATLLLAFAAMHRLPNPGFAAGTEPPVMAGPFIVRAEFPLAPYHELLGELAGIQQALQRQLHLPPPREPVEIVLMADEASYRQWMKTRFPKLPYRRAIYVKGLGRGTVYAFRSRDLAEDLRHEATHGLLHATLPMVPLWLDEGLAEYFEVPPQQRAAGGAHTQELSLGMRLGSVPSLAKLEKERNVADLSAGDYRDAWAWIHFMLHGPPAAQQELVLYLDDIRAATPPGQLSQRLPARVANLEKEFAEHFKKLTR